MSDEEARKEVVSLGLTYNLTSSETWYVIILSFSFFFFLKLFIFINLPCSFVVSEETAIENENGKVQKRKNSEAKSPLMVSSVIDLILD